MSKTRAAACEPLFLGVQIIERTLRSVSQQGLIPLARRHSRSRPPAHLAQTMKEHAEGFAGVQMRFATLGEAAGITRARSTQVVERRRDVIRHQLF